MLKIFFVGLTSLFIYSQAMAVETVTISGKSVSAVIEILKNANVMKNNKFSAMHLDCNNTDSQEDVSCHIKLGTNTSKAPFYKLDLEASKSLVAALKNVAVKEVPRTTNEGAFIGLTGFILIEGNENKEASLKYNNPHF